MAPVSGTCVVGIKLLLYIGQLNDEISMFICLCLYYYYYPYCCYYLYIQNAPELMLPPPPPLPELPPTSSVYSAADLQRAPGRSLHVFVLCSGGVFREGHGAMSLIL